MSDPMAALAKAIGLVGSQAELARRLQTIKNDPKIKQAHIWNWLNRDKEVPAEMVIAIEMATIEGDTQRPRVTRHELRPDIYPEPGPRQLELPA